MAADRSAARALSRRRPLGGGVVGSCQRVGASAREQFNNVPEPNRHELRWPARAVSALCVCLASVCLDSLQSCRRLATSETTPATLSNGRRPPRARPIRNLIGACDRHSARGADRSGRARTRIGNMSRREFIYVNSNKRRQVVAVPCSRRPLELVICAGGVEEHLRRPLNRLKSSRRRIERKCEASALAEASRCCWPAWAGAVGKLLDLFARPEQTQAAGSLTLCKLVRSAGRPIGRSAPTISRADNQRARIYSAALTPQLSPLRARLMMQLSPSSWNSRPGSTPVAVSPARSPALACGK